MRSIEESIKELKSQIAKLDGLIKMGEKENDVFLKGN